MATKRNLEKKIGDRIYKIYEIMVRNPKSNEIAGEVCFLNLDIDGYNRTLGHHFKLEYLSGLDSITIDTLYKMIKSIYNIKINEITY